MTWPLLIDPQTYAIACIVIAIAATVQGSTGLGFSMVAAPVLAILNPIFVPGPMLVLALFVSAMVALREWRSIDRKGIAYALAGRIPASFLAGFTVAAIPAAAFSGLFGGFVLLAVLLSWAGWRLVPTPRNFVMVGMVSGYMGTITSIGAPPMALIYQHSSGAKVRSSLGAYFVFGAAWSLIALAMFGVVGWSDFLLSVNLLPPLILGFVASNWVVTHINKSHVRRIVLIFCALSSGVLVAMAVI
ncbi:MAG: sulfite exporter TauE/SafE family protein [Alphaproteobacteria bacterium]